VYWKRKPFTPTRNQKKNGEEGEGNNVKEISIYHLLLVDRGKKMKDVKN